MASFSVNDVNDRFGLHIDATTYMTVGGFVLGRLSRRPRVGDVVDVEGRVMRVEALEGIRVANVWLSGPKDLGAQESAQEARESRVTV